ncbi:YrzI family small protein [Bacillus cereus]
MYDFSYFLFTTVLQKNTLTEAEINRKQQLKQLTDKMTDIKSSYYTQMY